MLELSENYKQIDDIIDARKRQGQYNVYKLAATLNVNYRYAYSSTTGATERFVRFDDTMLGDNLSIKRTDSEVTVVRIHCNSFKRRQSKWDMHDDAIPGDGSHLGDSPSLVNLATLVAQNVHCEGDEYLVPLSSWDPYFKNEDQHPSVSCCSMLPVQNPTDKCPYETYCEDERVESRVMLKRPSLARRISIFFRKHCKKSKTLPAGEERP